MNNTTMLNISKYCLGKPTNSAGLKYYLHNPVYLAWVYLVGIFSISGTVINATVLATVVMFSALRKGVGLLMPHLLACQLVVCAVICPFTLIKYLQGGVHCEDCRYYEPLEMTFAFVISWADAGLAINRVIAVLFPLKFSYITSKPAQYLTLGLIWVIPLLATGPPFFDSLALYRMTPFGTCTIVGMTKTAEFLFAINLYCPLAIVAVAAVLIGSKLLLIGRASVHVLPTNQTGLNATTATGRVPGTRRTERQKRMSRMLFMAFLCSIVCQLPLIIATLFSRNATANMYLGFWALMEYGLTPIIFITMNQDYQNGALILYGRLCGHAPIADSRPTESRSHRRSAQDHVVETQGF